jgi:hypothetical protein
VHSYYLRLKNRHSLTFASNHLKPYINMTFNRVQKFYRSEFYKGTSYLLSLISAKAKWNAAVKLHWCKRFTHYMQTILRRELYLLRLYYYNPNRTVTFYACGGTGSLVFRCVCIVNARTKTQRQAHFIMHKYMWPVCWSTTMHICLLLWVSLPAHVLKTERVSQSRAGLITS